MTLEGRGTGWPTAVTPKEGTVWRGIAGRSEEKARASVETSVTATLPETLAASIMALASAVCGGEDRAGESFVTGSGSFPGRGIGSSKNGERTAAFGESEELWCPELSAFGVALGDPLLVSFFATLMTSVVAAGPLSFGATESCEAHSAAKLPECGAAEFAWPPRAKSGSAVAQFAIALSMAEVTGISCRSRRDSVVADASQAPIASSSEAQ